MRCFSKSSRRPTQNEKYRLEDFLSTPSTLIVFSRNKQLVLLKPLLIDSENPEFIDHLRENDTYKIDIDLNVDDKKILYILLGLEIDIKVEFLVDYYIFFRLLGVRRGMVAILSILNCLINETPRLDVSNSLLLLISAIEKLDDNRERFTELLSGECILNNYDFFFSSSFCHLLFTSLSDRAKQLRKRNSDEEEEEMEDLDHLSIFFKNILKCSTTCYDITKHPDFSGFNNELEDKNCFESFFEFLFSKCSEEEEKNDSFTDLKLICEDGETPANLFILIWKSKFFHHNFFSTGRKNHYDIQMNMKKRSMDILKEYYYTNKIIVVENRKEIKFDHFLECLSHGEVHQEDNLVNYLVESFLPRFLLQSYYSTDKILTGFILQKLEVCKTLFISEQLRSKIIREIIKLFDHRIVELREIRNISEVRKKEEKIISTQQKRRNYQRREPAHSFVRFFNSGNSQIPLHHRHFSNRTRNTRDDLRDLKRKRNELKLALGKSAKFGIELLRKNKELKKENSILNIALRENLERGQKLQNKNKELELILMKLIEKKKKKMVK